MLYKLLGIAVLWNHHSAREDLFVGSADCPDGVLLDERRESDPERMK
jgi:hypothetical protein